MKKTLLLIAVFISSYGFAQQIKPAAKGVVYGAKTTADGAIEVNILEEKLAAANKFTGKLKGTVISVCEKKGCWMKIAQTDGSGIMIRFKDYKFFMPQDIVGKDVVLDGVAKKETVSVEDQKHYAEDAGKSAEEINKITEPSTEISFTAKGVLVVN